MGHLEEHKIEITKFERKLFESMSRRVRFQNCLTKMFAVFPW
jgi:hypothetical protein